MRRADDLVFALCHEVSNLVGAIRLHADLIGAEASPVELASVSVEIDDSSARIRSWLALVRPLLDREYGDESGVPPEALLDGVREALEEHGGRGVEVEVETDASLPPVRGRPETLHHLLVTLAYHAVEDARPKGRVRVGAERSDDDRVTLFVEDDGAADAAIDEQRGGWVTGRGLAVAAADLILGRLEGGAEAARDAGRTRVALFLPRFAGATSAAREGEGEGEGEGEA